MGALKITWEMTNRRGIVLVCFLVLVSSLGYGKDIPSLPEPVNPVYASTAQEIKNKIENATAGQTIVIRAGTYNLSSFGGWALEVKTGHITIRGETDNADDVILIGQGFETNSGELFILLNNVTDVTIANLSIRDVGTNAIKLQTGSHHNLVFHNIHFLDVCERCIKGPGVPQSENGIVRHCVFEQVKDLTPTINSNANGNYIGGIDSEHFVNWRIHDNLFKNIQGYTGSGRGGIYLKQNSSNIIVERNTFYGCDRSICFGNPSEGPIDVTDSIIRNNFFYACAGQAIELDHSYRIKIYNNSIHHMDNVLDTRTISILECDTLDFRNNIIFSKGNPITNSGYIPSANLWFTNSSSYANYFQNVTTGDFHLLPTATNAINCAVVLSEITDDWDGESRGGTPDLGADEIPEAPPANVPPSVDAGDNSSITLPIDTKVLNASVVDPDDTPAIQWSQLSGPGSVLFSNAHIVNSSASFTQTGTYVLKIEADDGTNSPVSDTVTITVLPEPYEQPQKSVTKVECAALTDSPCSRMSGVIAPISLLFALFFRRRYGSR